MLNDTDFVKYVAENYSYLVAEAVRKLEGMSVEQYLALVKKHYGDGVMGDLLTALGADLQFTKKFVLNEHHLYGSSRLGVKTHKRVLLRKEFSISGFEETGEIIVDEVTDSLVYVASDAYFCRVLAQKQYELSNHLGNVLATVLDRKTGVFDPVEDTLMYYTADVVNATLYYPYGSEMISYSNAEFNYSYGFNSGSEKDDEIAGSGNIYGTEWRMLDVRLGGRWWSPDRIVKPWESPYAGFTNNPIYYSDPLGLDPEKNSPVQPPSDAKPGDTWSHTTEGGTTWNYTYEDGAGWVGTGGSSTLPEVSITPNGGGNNTTAGNLTGAAGGTLGGLTLDFMIRDRVDYRNTYYNPKVNRAKELWKAGKLSDEAYAMYRYHAQKATKMQYRSSISMLMGEVPPTGKPLWQQKALAENIASGKTQISSGAGNTRGLTTKLSTPTATKIMGRTFLVASAGMSIYTVVTAENTTKALVTEGSGWAGAWGGATMGASIGAAIGGPFAPITGAVGGIIGGGIGYFFGSSAGEAVYEALEDE